MFSNNFFFYTSFILSLFFSISFNRASASSLAPPSCPLTVDLVVIEDVSYFGGDNAYIIKPITSAATDILTAYPGTNYGVVTYRDKPFTPFGDPGDWCFQVALPLQNNLTVFTQAMETASKQIVGSQTGDAPGSQYQAIMSTVQYIPLGWRRIPQEETSKIAKVVVLVTYTMPHYYGDGSESLLKNTWPNDGMTTQTNVTVDCVLKQYPTPTQVAEAVSDTGSYVVILSGQYNSQASSAWKWVNSGLLNQTDDMYQPLDSYASNMYNAFISGVNAAFKMACSQ